jgi:hypothetical protein
MTIGSTDKNGTGDEYDLLMLVCSVCNVVGKLHVSRLFPHGLLFHDVELVCKVIGYHVGIACVLFFRVRCYDGTLSHIAWRSKS